MQDLDPQIRRVLGEMHGSFDDRPAGWEAIRREAGLDRRRAGPRIYPLRSFGKEGWLTRRRALIAALAACAVAAALIPTALLPDLRLGASDVAAGVLKETAAAAATRSFVGSGRYAYTKERTLFSIMSSNEPPYTALIPAIRETWIAPDGSGRMREIPGAPMYLSERDRRREAAEGNPLGTRSRSPSDQQLPADPRAAEIASLPTDPVQLERVIRQEVETRDPPLTAAMVVQIGDLLNSPEASSDLRRALYVVLSRLQGVEYVGQVRDPLGRTGVAIAVPAGYADPSMLRKLLIFDPDTSQVLAVETQLLKKVDWIGADPPAVIESVTFEKSGWVAGITERPDELRSDSRLRIVGTRVGVPPSWNGITSPRRQRERLRSR